MSTMVIAIETGNAAFEHDPNAELARILRGVADIIEHEVPNVYQAWLDLRDINENKVGIVTSSSKSVADITKGL